MIVQNENYSVVVYHGQKVDLFPKTAALTVEKVKRDPALRNDCLQLLGK